MIRCTQNKTIRNGKFAGEYKKGKTYPDCDALAEKYRDSFELEKPKKKPTERGGGDTK